MFETIDRKKQGQITLEDFIKVSIPFISSKEMFIVLKWMSEPNMYNENVYLRSSKKGEVELD